ncbi:MAG: hypothetical protein IH584_06970, partial [Candidatus Aminicenantes bacterium]|nr:hypothetical protein [Candidatus Aminicenantes bacterium]
NQSFAISDMKVISRTPPDRLPPPRFKFPRLEVSKIDLTPNVDGFGIIFNYKNVGEAPLPKASEVPLKPSYRVLIDGRETAKGFLFIPAFAAQPGWEQKGYFGGWIVLPTSRAAEENNWHIGTTVTVHINENQVMGMKSHTLSLPLKPIALKYKCDALITGVSLNWQTRVVTVSLRVDGMFPASGNINLTCSDRDEFTISPSYKMSFFQTVVLMGNQHFYTISRKLGIPEHYRSITLYVKAYAPSGGNDSTGQAVDMDYRNNFWKQCKFVYPDSNPVR